VSGRAWGAFAALVALGGVAMCTRDRLRSEPAPTATVKGLGIYRPDRPSTLEEEGRLALEQDARRREERFREAASPGQSFAKTRVERAALRRITPHTIFELGGQLFHHTFTAPDGFGAKDRRHLSRVQLGRRGGPDAYSCADCHRVGGPAGAGSMADNAFLDGDGDRPSSALQRNPPSLAGAGVIELLAREMTAELKRARQELVARARREGEATRGELTAKGVSFGTITVAPDGKIDTRELAGVDADLVVKPFGRKGHDSGLLTMVEDQLALHHGMQTSWLGRQDDPERVGPFGVGDPDGDGVKDEITEGQLDALTLFVAMSEVPQIGMPQESERVARWVTGQQRFAELGCADCHRPSMPLESTIYELPSRDSGAPLRIDLSKHGSPPRPVAGAPVYLFSDLKRHVVGPYLREARSYRGVSGAAFITPPLWGLARSAPYLHDGRAATLDRAITEHSGEATAAAKAYAALVDEERAPVRIYLMSLTRARRLVTP
jgi:Di-haem oxidoreductase, putative peroxidase